MKRRKTSGKSILLGEVLSAIGFTRLAERILNRALKNALETNDSANLEGIYAGLAALWQRNGDLVKAIAFQKKALEVAPPDEAGMCHCELALLLKAYGDYENAAAHFVESLRFLSPDYAEYRQSIEVELQQCQSQALKRKGKTF